MLKMAGVAKACIIVKCASGTALVTQAPIFIQADAVSRCGLILTLGFLCL